MKKKAEEEKEEFKPFKKKTRAVTGRDRSAGYDLCCCLSVCLCLFLMNGEENVFSVILRVVDLYQNDELRPVMLSSIRSSWPLLAY